MNVRERLKHEAFVGNIAFERWMARQASRSLNRPRSIGISARQNKRTWMLSLLEADNAGGFDFLCPIQAFGETFLDNGKL
jgi:hypothetical protein